MCADFLFQPAASSSAICCSIVGVVEFITKVVGAIMPTDPDQLPLDYWL